MEDKEKLIRMRNVFRRCADIIDELLLLDGAADKRGNIDKATKDIVNGLTESMIVFLEAIKEG